MMSSLDLSPVTKPRNVVIVLLDSLNRHMLGPYGSSEFETPNLDRFAARAVRFSNHRTGSLPCMPARHDILCGALDFLWKPWGSIEVWEEPITWQLRAAGVTTMLVSDHPHLFETGGENYHTEFTGWEYVRGSEEDPWRTRPDPSWVGAPALPAAASPVGRHYDVSRTWFRAEEDFPGPKTLCTAAEWLDTNAGEHERFLLFVDEFDPHEPFDTPERWATRYDDTWEGDRLIWPPYSVNTVEGGVLSQREADHLRAQYGANLSMIDHWLGQILDAIDRHDLWSDTAVIVCTDHGHFLGEKDIFGKPAVPHYGPMSHIPLLVAWPGVPAKTCDALTTSVDLHATFADIFGVAAEHRTHGASLVPLIAGEADSIREWALCGIWGRWVHVFDGTNSYGRAPAVDGCPISIWSNRWTTMPAKWIGATPVGERTIDRLPKPDRRATLEFMPGSDAPVIRQPFSAGDLLPYWAVRQPVSEHVLFDTLNDPDENENLAGTSAESNMIDLLREALEQVEAPQDQYVRLGLA